MFDTTCSPLRALLPARFLTATVCGLLIGSCSTGSKSVRPHPTPEGVYLPDPIQDPLEPFNRGIWAFNEGLLEGVLSPAGKGYRMLVPSPARTSIHNFGYNLGYPGRALNQLLQGRAGDAGEESLRFVTNSTVGVLGLFDVASNWEIPKHRGNFGQTFQKWGWKGRNFVVLPLLGPSDEAYALGTGMDRLADPLAYHKTGRDILIGVNFNDRTENAEETLRLLQSDADSYSLTRYIWAYVASEEAPDWTLHGPRHAPTLESLAVATLRLRDPDFLERLREAKVRIPGTGRKLPFNYRLQKEAAPLVYVVPGLGSHRLTMQALAMAEGLYDRGFSVVALSSPFHPEFMEKASSVSLAGNPVADRKDLWAALDAIDGWMQRKHGDELGARAMVGCSLGGFQAMAMATEAADRRTTGSQVHFERFVAVNPPVDLLYGMRVLDGYQEAPADWPASLRQERINNTVHKAVALMARPKDLTMENPPFSATETKYIIGLAFRLSLRNAIYSSHRMHDLGHLESPVSSWNREEVYNEIMGYSFGDYLNRILLPHFAGQGLTRSQFSKDCDLKGLGDRLSRCDKVNVITSRNDFLLSPGDVAWLQRTFGGERLNLLDRGGHLGGLANPAFVDLVASKLAPLRDR